MSKSPNDPQLHPTVAFRPQTVSALDRVLAEHRTGFVDEAAGEVEAREGAVPPPPPSRPVPREPLAARMRRRFEQG